MNQTTMNQTTQAVERHNFGRRVREALNRAVGIGLIDAVDAAVLGARHGTDGASILATLCEWAFADRHGAKGASRHKEMCIYNDLFHAEQRRGA